MTLPIQEESACAQGWPSVSFADGRTQENTHIFDIIEIEGESTCFIILQRSCFHPRDFRWPDQPADRGSISWCIEQEGAIATTSVIDVVKMLRVPGHDDLFDTDIHFTKRDMPEGARLLVALKVNSQYLESLREAKVKNLLLKCQVDREFRRSLSIGHSLGHLASYALNQLMQKFWRKPVQLDTRGFPDFIALSQVGSQVFQNGTQDVYRVGKSFRKLGFNAADAIAALPELQKAGETLLNDWLKQNPQVKIECDGQSLDDSRRWVCQLGDEQFWMFCGGTHLLSFEELTRITLSLNFESETKSIVMEVQALGAPEAIAQACV